MCAVCDYVYVYMCVYVGVCIYMYVCAVCVCMCQDSQSIVFSKGMALQSPHSCLVMLVK